MLYLIATAFAAESPGPALLPNSTNSTRTVEIGAGAAGILWQLDAYCFNESTSCGSSTDLIAGPMLSASYAPDPHLTMHAMGIYAPSANGFIGVADLRVDAIAHPNIHFGPWVGAMTTGELPLVFGGLAVETGWEHVRFDTSMPLVGIGDGDFMTPDEIFYFAEAGVSFGFGEHHSLRLGMASVAPGIGWRSQFGPAFVEARLHTIGSFTAGNVLVGASF